MAVVRGVLLDFTECCKRLLVLCLLYTSDAADE